MGTFSYLATDGTAKTIRGTMEAGAERDVVAWLQGSGYFPIQVERADTTPAKATTPTLALLRRRVSQDDLILFTTQLATLTEAGLELDRTLSILIELEAGRPLERILRDVLREVRGGLSFADSLAKHPRVFSRHYVNMVRAGEAGGALEPVLRRLSAFLEGAKEVRDFVVSAMIYPTILLTVGGIAVAILLYFVIPRFAKIFAEAGQALPASTRLLMAASAAFTGSWWLWLGGLAAAVVLAQALVQTEGGRRQWDAWRLRLPILGRLALETEVARLCRTLGSLLQSGVPILQALSIVKETMGNRVLEESLVRVQDGVRRGEGVAGPLRATGLFPSLATHMITVGEETGRLEEMLLKVAEAYEARIRSTVKRLVALFEPAMILFLAAIVGFIVLSMLQAVFSLSELPG